MEALLETRLLSPLVVVGGAEGMGVSRLLGTLRNHAAVSDCLTATGSSLRELARDLAAHPSIDEDVSLGRSPAAHVFRLDAMVRELPPEEHPVLILDDVLSSVDAGESAAQVADRAAAVLRRPFHTEGRELRVEAKIGIAVFPDDAISGSDLIRASRAALEDARSRGSVTPYQFFSGDMNDRAARNFHLRSRLSGALEMPSLAQSIRIAAQSAAACG